MENKPKIVTGAMPDKSRKRAVGIADSIRALTPGTYGSIEYHDDAKARNGQVTIRVTGSRIGIPVRTSRDGSTVYFQLEEVAE